MHLGFHIYDVGFQSPNVEATTPLVFATAFLLVLVVIAMNSAAIALRGRLRRRYRTSGV
jgi:phosphate transport system permease protein